MGLQQSNSEYYIRPNNSKITITNFHPTRMITREEFFDGIFGSNNNEKICIFTKRSNGQVASKYVAVKDKTAIKRYVEMLEGQNMYQSTSTFYRTFQKKKISSDEKIKLRTQSNIEKTYCYVQDLDYYKLDKNLDHFAVMKEIEKMILNGDIICPNFVIISRGIQLVWAVKGFKNKAGYTHDLALRKLQSVLKERLSRFNSDSVVLDPSHVFRMPDTWHAGARKRVSVAIMNESHMTLNEHILFYDIIPYADRAVKPPKKGKTGAKVVRNTAMWSEFTLNRQREEDIFIYVNEKNRRGESYIGIRNWLCLVLRFHAIVSSEGDLEYAEKRVLELVSILDMSDTTEEELLRRSKTAERFYKEWKEDTWDRVKYHRGGLFYTNKNMLEIMKCTDDYEIQWKMKTIKLKTAKYEAERKRLERIRDGKIKGSMEEYNQKRVANKEEKLIQLKQLLKENPKAKQKELADILGVSTRYIRELKKFL